MVKLDGKAISIQIQDELVKDVNKLKEQGINPCLAVIQVGDRTDSSTYIRMKRIAAEKIGIIFILKKFSDDISQDDLLKEIENINLNKSISGLIIQLPLPDHIKENIITRAVCSEKDVDGFHIENIGSLVLRGQTPNFISCTPKGCLELLKRSNISIEGKDAVVLGRSNIVGIPMAHLLLQNNATVTICHSRTKNLEEKCRNADILVVAIGKPEFVKGSWIKEGAVIIDVGINSKKDDSRKSGYRLVGDVDYISCFEKASLITPVPGGVGPMTVTMLLQNTIIAAKHQIQSN